MGLRAEVCFSCLPSSHFSSDLGKGWRTLRLRGEVGLSCSGTPAREDLCENNQGGDCLPQDVNRTIFNWQLLIVQTVILYKRKKSTKNKFCRNIAVNILPPGVAKNRALTGQSACQYWSIYAPFNKVTKTVCHQTTFDK